MYSGVEGGDEDNDTRVNRNLFTRGEECDVYGYCPGWDVGRSFFRAVSGAGSSLSGYYAYRIRGSRFVGGYSGAGRDGCFCRDRGEGFL